MTVNLSFEPMEFHTPSTAKKASKEGYYAGGCKGNMGGTHYYQAGPGEWATRSPVDPIYNVYGANATKDGDLNSVLLYFGTFSGGGKGFDLGGRFTFKNAVYCTNYCADPDCLTEIPDRPFDYAIQSIHIMFTNPLTPVECQNPTV